MNPEKNISISKNSNIDNS